ncbi:DNA-binding transcriptional LysR family regulator [Paraburkholderia bannensis]|uniref:DNA-binding transcriptional LysR family regulator n=1 Tax=Paraburkholderia bannensis TaxID=765414 RepID=A0A7W9WSD8_9BURK|nr:MULTISPECIES: LysR family transcriptional regulator [Paraburkholderia]MBB3257185.1 DNA-binding transcriptional LysR family regulator [Paraburkholderia sp. WP4_3_2]MBB6102419.1 DNA-binding transcriptional LysR family regulator [Paraburkholderia bannensis]
MTDFNRIDLNLMRVFQAVLEERSLTQAGKRLGLSQPATSYALGRLRALFDDPLFIRTPEGMLPTLFAQRISDPVGRSLAAAREAIRQSEQFDSATSTREFRLSMSDVGEQVFLPAICEKLQKCAPGVCIAAETVPLTEVEERMRLGRLDFAIGNLPSLKATTLHELLFNEEYACMTRKRPGLPSRRISAKCFQELSHVAVASADRSHVLIEESLRQGGLHRRIALRVSHFNVTPDILRHTDWMVTLPRGVAKAFNESGHFAIYPLPIDLPRFESTLHWHELYDGDTGIRWLRQLLVETLGH